MTTPIPGPTALPIIGNLRDIDPEVSIISQMRLADTYGEIYKLYLGGEWQYFISTHALYNEICDEKRFQKVVAASLLEVRNGLGDGLFTAHRGEHNWEVAHRTLMPAFGPLAIHGMFDEMHDIATQLVAKWARFGPKEKIRVTDDFTRLTLDSIALCAMGTRFNSFYHEELHPFVIAMNDFLAESGERYKRPSLANYFMRSAQQKYDSDINLLRSTAAELLAERRANPTDKKDLLNAMINGRDPKTGESLTDECIMSNMVTFLVAGHETTSGLLSFLFLNLVKNPATYQAAQREVDEVIGRGPITVEHMSKLPYLESCMRETLRLTPTAPKPTMGPLSDGPETVTIGNGKYAIPRGTIIHSIIPKIHRDPAIYDDVETFNPDRMSDENFKKLPPNAWKPFGNGMRGCIGRPFAWQEGILAAAMLLQTFNFRMDDPGYSMKLKQTLTIKPKDFYLHATLRDHIDVVHLEKILHIDPSGIDKSAHKPEAKKQQVSADGKSEKGMSIFYGSNAGTCESLAQSLARVASGRGYKVHVDPLDSTVDKIPKDQLVILISSSYEGQPPDNAAHFVEWIQGLNDKNELKGVKFATYGCGNHDWVSTFHRIPKLLDECFEKNGATRITDMGLGDVAEGDIFEHFDKWQDDKLWAALGSDAEPHEQASLEIEIDTDSRRSRLRQEVKEAVVVSNELLTAPGEPEKRHIVLELPTGMEYNAGDYLAVLPMNNTKIIRRVLKWAGLPWDTMLTIKPGENTTLPTGHPISLMDILAAYVELSQPATRKNVARIAASATDEKVRSQILALAGDNYEKEILMKRRSPLDILEEYPDAKLPLSEYLAMLPPMRIRQYSISSTPLDKPNIATITWAVLDTPAYSSPSSATNGTSNGTASNGNTVEEKRFYGVASNYLSHVEAGDRIHVAVKPAHGKFHPPEDVENTPVLMFCAGTGLAPFRGFVQERAIQIAGGRKLAPAYLFIGCKHPDRDLLFASELKKWENDGAVRLYYAFSEASVQSKGAKYVQDRLWEERDEARDAFKKGARLFVCGSSNVGEGVADVTKKIYIEGMGKKGEKVSEDQAKEWFAGIKSDRFASDVFA